jgi:exopolysaccharide biosynthesis polyprenyl glycosylphosphotransferase
MLKEQAKLFTKIAIVIDAIAIVTAFVTAYYLRSAAGRLAGIEQYTWILLIVLPAWYFLLTYFGLYASLRIHSYPSLFAVVAKVHAVGAMVASSVIFLVDPHSFSRMLFGYFIILSVVLVCLEKAMLKLILSFIRRKGYNSRNILIVGTNEKSKYFAQLVKEHVSWGLRTVGFLQCKEEPVVGEFSGCNVLGQIDEIKNVCKFYAVDEVVFCLPKEYLAKIEDYLNDLESMGITVRMVLDFYSSRAVRKELSYFHDHLPILTFYAKPFDAGQLFLKRCMDIVGAVIGLGITSLLFPFIALAIRLDSPGPLLFGQLRVGESGRLFKCWKFRSMYVDAEERKQELLHLNEMQGAIFKIRDDPRITKTGNFLRKTSLDELPQFWNALKGEMSLVGTRPPTPDEVTTYENWHRKRICIKPGITGLWQVSGRNQIQVFDEVVRLDIEYIDKWTLWLDIKILVKTFWVVFARQGSH